MEKYEVEVDDDGAVRFYKPGTTDRHRLDGPAVVYADGSKYWYVDGVRLTESQFKKKTAPVKELTVAEIEKLLGHRVKIVK